MDISLPNSQEDASSTWRTTNKGVPRGTVLGPFLFCTTSTTPLSVWNHRHSSLPTTASCAEKSKAKMVTLFSNKTLKILKRGPIHRMWDSMPRSATSLAPVENSTIVYSLDSTILQQIKSIPRGYHIKRPKIGPIWQKGKLSTLGFLRRNLPSTMDSIPPTL